MKTFGTFFSGGGLADVGLKAAGLTPVFGVEIEPHLAEVYRANHGDHVTVADVRHVDLRKLERPDWFHASPVCTEFSQAKTGGKESALDIECAEATARAITYFMPDIVTIENVWQYRSSKSLAILIDAMTRAGYWVETPQHLNAANFGVAQTRKRLFMRASKDGWLPPLPERLPWVGWYQAIEDLIPGLPESEFAPWQLERLNLIPEVGSWMFNGQENEGRAQGRRASDEPCLTVTAAQGRRPSQIHHAFLIDDAYGANGAPTTRDTPEPAFTLTARNGGLVKGFICEGSAAGPNNAYTMPVRTEDEPVFTMRAGQYNPRAFIVDGQQTNPGKTPGDRSSRTLITRDQEEPIWTVPSSVYKGEPRAWLAQGRVVKMSARALARFMGLTDTYQLPDNNKTACTVIGNGVCPPIMEALARPFVN